MKTADPKTEREVLDAIRRQLPVGYIPNHTNKNLPELVMYHVQRSALLGELSDQASEILQLENERITTDRFTRFVEGIAKI